MGHISTLRLNSRENTGKGGCVAQKWLPNDYEPKPELRCFPPPFSMSSWRSRAALLITHVDDTDLQYCVWVRWQDGKPSPRTDESQTKYRCTLSLTPFPGLRPPLCFRFDGWLCRLSVVVLCQWTVCHVHACTFSGVCCCPPAWWPRSMTIAGGCRG